MVGSQRNNYSIRTTLLEQDLTLMKDKSNKVVGLEIFFSSEKVPKEYGSRVQLPLVNQDNLKSICPVRAYIKYQEMKSHLNQQSFSPWLIDFNGKPIIQSNLVKLIKRAVNETFRNTMNETALKDLHGHSFRSALPTELQFMRSSLSEEERKMLGRWLSTPAFLRYCKDKTNARFDTAIIVNQELSNSL